MLKQGKGGLGIRNLNFLNRALLGKWIWRFTLEKIETWRTCIMMKYGTGEEDWSLNSQGEVMGFAYGKQFQRNSSFSSRIADSSYEMVPKLDFGKTSGVVKPFCVFLIRLFIPFPTQKGLPLLRFGCARERGIFGIQILQGNYMIKKWR